jgi:large subunit ribosomal protein L4e
MELAVLNTKNENVGKKSLPTVFDEVVRTDIIKRAVQVSQKNARQPYGANPRAGKNYSATLSRRRRKYRGGYGKGISRVPRKIMMRRGTWMHMVAAIAPGTVGGRRAHAPLAEKIWGALINRKEKRKAIRSAMAATVDKELVVKHGHKVPAAYPFLIDKSFEELETTKQVNDALKNLNLTEELSRVKEKKIRAGKGTMRGRKYKKKVGPLLVVGGDCKLVKSAKNIPGVEVVSVENLNAQLLAPGTVPGRLTLYTTEAIEKLDKEKLFA